MYFVFSSFSQPGMAQEELLPTLSAEKLEAKFPGIGWIPWGLINDYLSQERERLQRSLRLAG